MSALRDAAERIARMGRFQTPNASRRLACEKALGTLDGREARIQSTKESWDDFLRRIGVTDD